MTFGSSLRLVVATLALFLASSAHAALCFEELTDATVCGASVVEDATLCGVEKVTDATECGTKKVKDAAKCGTETVTDGAVCGWETLTGVANCAGKCLGSLGTKCTCKVAKSCKEPKRCRIAKTCDKPRSCQKPKTCTRKLASCDPFPELWRATVIAAINEKHQDHLDKIKAVKVPEQAAMASMVAENVKDLPDTLGPYLNLISAKSKRFVDALNDEKMLELLKRVILKCANRDIDSSVKRDLKELATFLSTKEDRVTEIKLPLREFGALKTTAAKGDDDDEEGRVARRKSRPPYPRVHAITLNLGTGIAANASISIGAVFDDEGNVAGFFSGGYGFGIQGRIGGDITYTMIPADSILDAGGVDIGLTGDAAYIGGVAVAVAWGVPGTTAIPSWSLGPTVGMGGGAAYACDTGFVFAPIMKK